MELTFGLNQVHTSERMQKSPGLAKIFNTIFGYTNVGNYARFTIFKKLINQVELAEDAKILDLGTGYGEYSFALANALPQADVHSLDIDAERIQTVNRAIKASETHNVTTHCMYTDMLSEKEFDLVFSVDVFEHIEPSKMPFSDVYKRLKTGGYFILKIPNVTQKTILPEHLFEDHHEWLEDEHVGQVYNLNGLSERFEEEGFEIVHSSYSDGWFSRLGWELAYLGKKAGVLGQLATLPLAKGLIHLDRLVHRNKWGNAIQVIGKKK